MAEHTRLKIMALPGTPCRFFFSNQRGSCPSSDAWYSDRPQPMMAFSTDRASAAISGSPTNHFSHDPGPKMWLVLELARIGKCSWSPRRAGVPPVSDPCLANQATDGDDGVGKVEERVDDVLVALVAALQPAEGVVPGIGPLDVPALPGLDRGLVALAGDFPGHAPSGELVAGLLRVVAGVEVDSDVIGQRANIIEFVQRGGQQRGVVPVRRGEHPAERDAVPLDHERPLHALLAAVHRASACAFPAAGRLGDTPVDSQFLQEEADDAVIGVPGDLLELHEDPCLDPLAAALADRGGTAGAVGDGRVRAAE